MLTSIFERLNNVCRALGVKKVPKEPKIVSRLIYPDTKELPTVDEVLTQFGGKGVFIDKKK